MSSSYKYDAFLSYSHEDKDWVRGALLHELERRGFSIMIDYRDFSGGAFGAEEMQRGVTESKRVVIVLTNDYVSSMWSKLESVMAQSLDPGAVFRKIIPVLRKDCSIPLRLGVLHYRDLRVDDAEQWDLLVRDLL